MRLLVATRSRGKLGELTALLAPLGYELFDLAEAGIARRPEEDSVECFDTFEANALAKARYFAPSSGGAPVIADDSGLVVTALGGQPGVRSKRWSERSDLEGYALDAANNAKLLAALAGAPDRSARFVSVVALLADGREVLARGECAGEILQSPRGEDGFGYDPLFYSPELGKTFAEASSLEKSRVSHRGRALQALIERLGERH